MIKDEYLKIYEDTNNIISCMNLFKSAALDEEKYKVIHNFDLACEYAFEYNEFSYKGEDEYMWSDIKSNIFSEVTSHMYKRDNYKEIDEVIKELKLISLSDVIMSKEADRVFDEIDADLTICMRTRIIIGKENKFFEDILEVYSLGGWPCGWDGKYPDGKLIVYCPEQSIN